MTVRVGEQIYNAAVDSDGWLGTGKRVWLFELYGHAREPRVAVAHERAGLRCTTRQAVHDCGHGAELRKHHDAIATVAFDAELLRRDHGRAIVTLALPVWCMTEPLEAALPRLIEFNEQLRADVARHVREPG